MSDQIEEQIPQEEQIETIRLRDCLFYLFGCSKSIRKLARAPRLKTIGLGAIFVLIAGICREYDQESIIYGFGLFIAPFFVSFAICCILRLFLLPHYRSKLNPNGLGSFWTLLALFWLTAPCAWIYAIPVEEFCDPIMALKINMFILAVVVVWRVVLFNRIMKVLTGVTTIWAVLAVAAPIVVVVTVLASLSIVGIMGGGNRTEEQQLLMDVNGAATVVAFYGAIPLWIIYIGHAIWLKKSTCFEGTVKATVSPVIKVVCPIILLAAIGIMIPAQMRLGRLYEFKDLVNANKHSEALAYANQFEDWQFPATQRMYPPRQYYGFEDAARLFTGLKGTEKDWLKRDVEKWLTRGLGRRYYNRDDVAKLLDSCPVTDYHRGVLEQHRLAIKEDLGREEFSGTDAIDRWLKELDITLEDEPGETE